MENIELIAKLKAQMDTMKAQIRELKKQEKPELLEANKKRAEEWWTARGNSITKRGLKIELPIGESTKEFEGIEFSDGRTAVYCRGGSYLKQVIKTSEGYIWK